MVTGETVFVRREVLFLAEAMLLDGARKNARAARDLQPEVDAARARFEDLAPSGSSEGELTQAQYEREEQLAIMWVDHAFPEFQQKLFDLNQHVATTCILAAGAAEAFINRLAKERLKPASLFDTIDRLDPIGKWVVASRLLGCPDPFDRGEHALQQVQEVFERRNSLMHFKPKAERNLRYPELSVTTIEEEMNADLAEAGVAGVEELIREFHKRMGDSPPEWLEFGRRHLVRDVPPQK